MSERVWAPLTGFTLHSCAISELEMDKICVLGYGLCKLSHLKIYQVESMSVYGMDYDQIELRSGSYPGKIPSRQCLTLLKFTSIGMTGF